MMKRQIKLLLAVAVMLFAVACSHDNGDDTETEYDKTLLMYLPWSGDSNALTSFFWTNIDDMKKAYDQYATAKERVIVFICTSGTKAVMFDIADYTGHDEQSLEKYWQIDNPQFTTVEGIATIINRMKAMAEADTYAMTIGCHGLGWLPVSSSKQSKKGVKESENQVYHWSNKSQDGMVTRYFGGTSAEYKVDIATFADALSASDTKLQFLLFDDCYMSSVEVAYDLRDVADYLIACPTEVMGAGMPYARIGRYLLGAPDYDKVCTAFYDYYSDYGNYSYGTIAVTKCSELDALAEVAKRINDTYQFDADLLGELQRMDGYSPILFYDYGDYVAHLCTDQSLLQAFNEQLAKTVPYKANTARYYSAISGKSYPIHSYSGITTSEPSTNSLAQRSIAATGWYKATH